LKKGSHLKDKNEWNDKNGRLMSLELIDEEDFHAPNNDGERKAFYKNDLTLRIDAAKNTPYDIIGCT
jgi:hypothetical protein